MVFFSRLPTLLSDEKDSRRYASVNQSFDGEHRLFCPVFLLSGPEMWKRFLVVLGQTKLNLIKIVERNDKNYGVK